MVAYTIRQATQKDIPGVEQLHVKLMRFEKNELFFCSDTRWPLTPLSRKYRQQNLRSRNGYLEVATVNKKIIGFAQGWVGPSQPWRRRTTIGELSLMFVEKKYRRLGIGRALMESFINWSKMRKAKRLTLVVVTNNKRAMRLYEKNTFKPYFINMERDI